MKGKYRGYVVGGDSWKVNNNEGFPYKVLTLDNMNENTGLHRRADIVSASVEGKKFDPSIKVGDFVEFDGEFKPAYGDSKPKMAYTGMKVITPAKK